MGLDSNFSKAHKDAITAEVDFEVDNEKYKVTEVAYFRKNSALQGWMRELYRGKGGTDAEFNCSNVLVTIEDLLRLKDQLKHNEVKATTGFFFGEMDEGKYEYLKAVIAEMITNHDKEYPYFYCAWY